MSNDKDFLYEFFDTNDNFTRKFLMSMNEAEEKELYALLIESYAEDIYKDSKFKDVSSKLSNTNMYKDIAKHKNDLSKSETIKTTQRTLNKLKENYVKTQMNKDIIKNDPNQQQLEYIISILTGFTLVLISSAGNIPLALLVTLVTILEIELVIFIINFFHVQFTGEKDIKYGFFNKVEGRYNYNIKLMSYAVEELRNNLSEATTYLSNGNVTLFESFNSNNILNEILHLPSKISKGILSLIVNIVRYPVYFIYNTRISIDEYIQFQIMFLEDNLDTKGDLPDKVRIKQQKWINDFKKLSAKISLDYQKAEKSSRVASSKEKLTYSQLNNKSKVKLNRAFEF